MIDFILSIHWREPLWFLLILLPVLLWFVIQWLKSKHQQQFADKHLLPWIKADENKTIWQRIFSRDNAYFLAWLGFALAMAGPRLSVPQSDDPTQADLDIMLVVDLSRSMQARDIQPSRLRRATLEAYEFLSIVKSARVGVIVYAARPHLYVPLTTDKNALAFYLKELDTLELPTHGSDPIAAIKFAQARLSISANTKKHIIWMSDGDLEESQYAKLGVAINHPSIITHSFIIAAIEGAEIPTSDGSWLTIDGKAITTQVNTVRLSKTFKKWGGVLSILNDDESDWQAIYRQGILKSTATNDNQTEYWDELYAWFLVPAFILFFFALYPSLKTLFLLIMLASLVVFSNSFADEQYLPQLYKGAAAYKNDEFTESKTLFIQAVLSAKTNQERGMALHNLGNALFQVGDYKTAMQLYADALSHDASLHQSAENLKLSDELFTLLEKRMKPPSGGDGITSNNLLVDLPDVIPESATTQAVNLSKFTLPKLPKEKVDELLQKGLDHLKLIQSENNKSEAAIKAQLNMNEARQFLLGLGEEDTSSTALWKRLFEIEEGFPASLKKPEIIPGVRPW